MSPSISEGACSKSLPGRQEPLWYSSKPPEDSLFTGHWAGRRAWLHLLGPPLPFLPVRTELSPTKTHVEVSVYLTGLGD